VWQGLRVRRPSPGLRPVRYAYAPPSVEKLLGSLPVVAEFCQRLDVAGVVDRACPVREVARVTHGQVIEALVANRLSSPRPLLRVADWAGEWAVGEVFGIAPMRSTTIGSGGRWTRSRRSWSRSSGRWGHGRSRCSGSM
jgi:hypothetical protein